ncbi:hypothetical protein HPP92_000493 [Vanilla planifolia]|uniref:Uncharacterized protein n=1 Tax=Vanilla planifolia TaxID=51239 RepID=A0A835VEG0_VANPL|nr:hypothetical protein HPP92_000493 [Vanilla planifolia]
MPSGSKKRKAMRRKAEAANHHPLPGPSANYPNIRGGDHEESSEHQLIEEEFSPRAAMEEPPHEPKPLGSDDSSLVPVDQGTVAETEPPEAVVETELTPAAVSEALAITESPPPLQVEETSGKAFLQVEGSEIPVSTSRVEGTSDEAVGLESQETEIPVSSRVQRLLLFFVFFLAEPKMLHLYMLECFFAGCSIAGIYSSTGACILVELLWIAWCLRGKPELISAQLLMYASKLCNFCTCSCVLGE